MKVLAITTVLATGISGVAFAVSGNGNFDVQPFHAFATITPDPPMVLATCTNPYNSDVVTNVHITGKGPITSNDPHFNGIFHVNAMILTNQGGVGVSRDKWTITDNTETVVLAKGVAQALDTDKTAPIIAVNTARLYNAGGKTTFASHIAVVRLPNPSSPLLTIEYGGPVPSDRGRAVLMGVGDCGGYFAADEEGYFPKHHFSDNDQD